MNSWMLDVCQVIKRTVYSNNSFNIFSIGFKKIINLSRAMLKYSCVYFLGHKYQRDLILCVTSFLAMNEL